jgi:hypothetical protein
MRNDDIRGLLDKKKPAAGAVGKDHFKSEREKNKKDYMPRPHPCPVALQILT